MATQVDLKEYRRRMKGAVDVLHKELGGLRTGRASPSLLESIEVDAYGGAMPLNQLATVSVAESRLLTVQVWDRSLASAIEKAIRNANLGLNPSAEGQLIRVPIPELNEERRAELTKVAAKYAEQARVAVRNVRRDGMEHLKQLDRDGEISHDEHHRGSVELQKLTDEMVSEIDGVLAAKESDIMQV